MPYSCCNCQCTLTLDFEKLLINSQTVMNQWCLLVLKFQQEKQTRCAKEKWKGKHAFHYLLFGLKRSWKGRERKQNGAISQKQAHWLTNTFSQKSCEISFLPRAHKQMVAGIVLERSSNIVCQERGWAICLNSLCSFNTKACWKWKALTSFSSPNIQMYHWHTLIYSLSYC